MHAQIKTVRLLGNSFLTVFTTIAIATELEFVRGKKIGWKMSHIGATIFSVMRATL